MSKDIQVSNGKKWIKFRKWIQAAAFVIFALTILFTRTDGLDPAAANISMRLSPLAMIANLISSRTFLSGSTLALILLLSSVLVGRAWCGWLCPLGTMLDLFSFSKLIKHRRNLPDTMRSIKYFLLITSLFAALAGNLTLLLLDPITIGIRSLSGLIFPTLDHAIFGLERALVNVPFLRDAILRFDQWLRPGIFPAVPVNSQFISIFLLTFIILIALNLLAERFWCRYLCPLGALLGLGSKLSVVKRTVSGSCTQCRLCASRCPTGTIKPDHGFASDPSECTLCLDCFRNCSSSRLEIAFPARSAPLQRYDPNRRVFLSSLGTAALGALVLKTDWLHLKHSPFILRPPGANPEVFLSSCIRCGLCVKACPTGALQVDLSFTEMEGISSPVLIPRTGYCDYGCNTCGQICPVQAIPPLPLEEKRKEIIGKAVIDQNRCLAWSQHTPCIVCEEMCPIPDKAIRLQKEIFTDPSGNQVEILLPHVRQHRCIGCGICEYKCPLEGEAAIRVYSL